MNFNLPKATFTLREPKSPRKEIMVVSIDNFDIAVLMRDGSFSVGIQKNISSCLLTFVWDLTFFFCSIFFRFRAIWRTS